MCSDEVKTMQLKSWKKEEQKRNKLIEFCMGNSQESKDKLLKINKPNNKCLHKKSGYEVPSKKYK